jgi:hypothetical protein
MIDEVIANFQCVIRSLSSVRTGLLRGQWSLADAGFRTADKLLRAGSEPPFPTGAAGPAPKAKDKREGGEGE